MKQLTSVARRGIMLTAIYQWRSAVMEYVVFDLGKVNSQICLLTEDGELVEKRLKTERETLTQFFGRRSEKVCILIEASTESEWVARCLEEIGCQVIVADPNFAPMYATRSKKVKTDRRDARALCEACRLGAYRTAHRISDEARATKNLLAVREQLVLTRSRYISFAKSLLRGEGLRLNESGCRPPQPQTRSDGIADGFAANADPVNRSDENAGRADHNR